MSPNDMEAKPKQKVEGREESTRPGAYFLPPVDIFETRDELVLLADMPGVPPGGVDVSLEGDELTITGRVRPDDLQPGGHDRQPHPPVVLPLRGLRAAVRARHAGAIDVARIHRRAD